MRDWNMKQPKNARGVGRQGVPMQGGLVWHPPVAGIAPLQVRRSMLDGKDRGPEDQRYSRESQDWGENESPSSPPLGTTGRV